MAMEQMTAPFLRKPKLSIFWWLMLPLVVGALFRAAAIWYFAHIAYVYPDEDLYWELGHRLLGGFGISLSHPAFGGYVAANEPSAYFGAIFPPVVAGLQVLTRDSLFLSRMILGEFTWLATALAMAAYARISLSRGQVSLILWALAAFPNLHFIGSFLMTENLLIPCVCLALFTGAKLRQSPKFSLAGWWSVLYGLMHLIKMNLLLFQPVQFLLDTRCVPMKRRLALAGASALLTGVILFPWALRNHQVMGRWTLETKSGFNLWLMNNPNHVQPIWKEDFSAAPPQTAFDGMSEPQRDDACKALFRDFLMGHPGKVAQLCVSRFLIAFRPTPYSMNLPAKIAIPYGLGNCLIYALAIVGMINSFRRGIFQDAVALMIYTAVITALTNASFRHRSYADPAMIMLAVAGAVAVWRRVMPPAIREAPAKAAVTAS